MGKSHGAKPAAIVSAIGEMTGLSDKDIGCIDLHDQFSFIELPQSISTGMINAIKKAKLGGQHLHISQVKATTSSQTAKSSKPKRKTKKRNL